MNENLSSVALLNRQMKKKSSFSPWNDFICYISKALLNGLKSDNRTCRKEYSLDDNSNNKYISACKIVFHLLYVRIIG